MKKFFAIQMMLLLAAASAMADNKLVIKDFHLIPGQEQTVEVLLENDDDMATFEFYLDVPEGLEIVSLPAATDRIPTNRGTWISQWKNTAETMMYVTYLSSDPTKPSTYVQGNSGVVATFVVKAAEEAVGKKLHVHGVELVDPQDNAIEQEDFDVTVIDYAPVMDVTTPEVLKVGQVYPVTLSLNNEVECSSLQFNIKASEGLTFVTDEEGSLKYERAERNNADNISASQLADGSYRVVLSNVLTNVALNGNEGDFITLWVKVAEDNAIEAATVDVYNMQLSDRNSKRYVGKDYTINYVLQTLTVLDDANGYNVTEDIKDAAVSYTRTYKNTNYQAIFVPFDVPYEVWSENFSVYSITSNSLNDNGGAITVSFYKLEGDMKAMEPYLIKAHEVGTYNWNIKSTTLHAAEPEVSLYETSTPFYKFSMYGTYTTISGLMSKGAYAMSGGTLKKASNDNVTLAPYRWYMVVTEKVDILDDGDDDDDDEVRVVFLIDDEEATAIETVVAHETENSAVYSIDGKQVNANALQRGLYIKNGQKVIIK